MKSLVPKIENLVFENRLVVVLVFLAATLFLAYQASLLKLDAGFKKNIPLQHEYIISDF